MSAKLDQSLDELTKGARRNHPRRVRPKRSSVAKAAPTGGVSKKTNGKANSKAAAVAAVAAAAPGLVSKGAVKVIVSGLPVDVDEKQIEEYFGKTIGPIKRTFLTYGPDGKCKGIATIEFRRSEDANKAVKQLHGVKIDGRPMRLELVVNAAAVNAPPVKDLSQRIAAEVAKPAAAAGKKGKVGAKNQPKSAAATGTAKGAGKQNGTAKGGKRAPRPKKKTAEELDAEMTDYFGAGNAPAATGAANGVVAGGDSMEVS